MKKFWRQRWGNLATGVEGWPKAEMLQYILQHTANEMDNPEVVRITIKRTKNGWSLDTETRQPLSWWLQFWKFWQFREP